MPRDNFCSLSQSGEAYDRIFGKKAETCGNCGNSFYGSSRVLIEYNGDKTECLRCSEMTGGHYEEPEVNANDRCHCKNNQWKKKGAA